MAVRPMKKQELIHLHGLLAEISTEFEDHSGKTLPMDEYETLGVRPTSIHRSKTEHKAAVFALADCITESMSETAAEPVPAAAD